MTQLNNTLTRDDGRVVGFSDFGDVGGTPVLWCHGGPGSRLEAADAGAAAIPLGLRLIGIDRPGYGLSTPYPGRTIADWVGDGLAVADALGLDQFLTAGMSTGAAYSLALAAMAPERVSGVVVGCGMTDMRHAESRAGMSGPSIHGVWDATDRDAAIAIATEAFGEDGSKMFAGLSNLPPADVATITDPHYVAGAASRQAQSFAHGALGYVDDRLADGPGWFSFDIGAVRAPVIIVHGGSDTIVPVVAARHSASLIQGAELRVFPDLGHLSIGPPALAALVELAKRP